MPSLGEASLVLAAIPPHAGSAPASPHVCSRCLRRVHGGSLDRTNLVSRLKTDPFSIQYGITSDAVECSWQVPGSFVIPFRFTPFPTGLRILAKGCRASARLPWCRTSITGKPTQRLRHTPPPPAAFARSSAALRTCCQPPITYPSRINEARKSWCSQGSPLREPRPSLSDQRAPAWGCSGSCTPASGSRSHLGNHRS
jgi:hypothetical protein